MAFSMLQGCAICVFTISLNGHVLANPCEDDKCSTAIDIPLITKLNAPLKAELDISILTEQLRELITHEVKHAVSVAMKDLVEGIVDKKTQSALENLQIVNNQTISTFLKEMKDIARKFKDCTELNRKTDTQKSSGVYKIYPMGTNAEGVPAYCDLKTDGGGWTVIQRRSDGSVDFQRTWVECENGFGNVNRELWLGNKCVHLLTSGGHFELRIDLTDVNNGKSFAVYSTFIVGDSASKYNLTVSGYSGNAGDNGQNFLFHNGKVFTTIDQKNDQYQTNCAKLYKRPWWYDSCYAGCNLNRGYSTKMVWNANKNIVQSVMMIREQ